jgi:hypothetical protein
MHEQNSMNILFNFKSFLVEGFLEFKKGIPEGRHGTIGEKGTLRNTNKTVPKQIKEHKGNFDEIKSLETPWNASSVYVCRNVRTQWNVGQRSSIFLDKKTILTTCLVPMHVGSLYCIMIFTNCFFCSHFFLKDFILLSTFSPLLPPVRSVTI